MGWGALAQGGSQVLSTGLTNWANAIENKKAFASSARMAEQQMAFQEHMSNTAHQREVKDLREAGLNPILSVTGGKGASTPSGAMATRNATKFEAPKANFLEISSAVQSLRKLKAEADMATQDASVNKVYRELEHDIIAPLNSKRFGGRSLVDLSYSALNALGTSAVNRFNNKFRPQMKGGITHVSKEN